MPPEGLRQTRPNKRFKPSGGWRIICHRNSFSAAGLTGAFANIGKMILNRPEMRVLAMIWNAYPIVHDPGDDSVIAIGERPLLTAACIESKLPGATRDTVDTILRKLESFQCVARVYLHHAEEFVEQTGKSGKALRMVVLGPPKGQHAYQVTEIGKQRLDSQWSVCFRAAASSVFAKAINDYLHMVIAFLLGAWLTSYFGFTLSGLPTLNKSGEPPDARETSAPSVLKSESTARSP